MAKEAGTAEKHVNGLKKTLGGVWRITGGILLFNVIRHITHSIRDLIGTVLDFETQMYNVNSVAQLSTEEFKKFQNQVLDLALDPRIKDSPAVLAAGLYEIVSAGYSAQDALILVKTAAIAATAGMTTTDVAADVLISTLGAYSLGVEHAAEVSDQLFQIVNISKYTFPDLANALASVTPVASTLGVGIDEVGAAMATMAAQGVDAETATVQLNAVMTGFLKPTEAMTKALLASGYASGEALIEARGLGGALEWAAEQTGGSAEAASDLFGDVRALRGILQLTKEDAAAYNKNLELMGHAQDGAGATAKALEQQMKASSFQIAVLRKNIQVLAILGFGLLAPHLNKALTGINKFVSGSISGFRHFREKGYGILEAMRAGIKKTLLDMFGPDVTKKVLHFFDTFVSYFLAIKSVVLAVWGPLKAVLGFFFDHLDIIVPAILGAIVGIKLLGAALAILNIYLAITTGVISPLLIVMLAVAAIGALVAVIWFNNWGDIQGKTKVAVQFIGKWIGKLWEFIQPAIDVIKLLGDYWHDVATNKLQPRNLEKLPGWIRPIALVIARVIKSVRVFIVTWQKFGAIAAFKTIPKQLHELVKAIGAFLTKLTGMRSIGDLFKKQMYLLIDTITTVVSFIDNIIHGRWGKAWDDLKHIFMNGIQFVINGLRGSLKILVELFHKIPWGDIGMALWNGFKFAVEFLMTTGLSLFLQAGIFLLGKLWEGVQWTWTNVIVPGIIAIPQLLVDLLSVGWDLLYSVGNLLIAALSEGITFGWNWLIGWFKNLPSMLTAPFVDIYWSFWNVGWSIIAGMSAGIQYMWNTLTGWIDDILGQFNRIPSWLRKGSPSKTMAENGMSAMTGLSIGIEKGIPKLKKSVDNVMSVIQRPSSLSSGSPGSSGVGRSGAGTNIAGNVGGIGSLTVQVTVEGAGDPVEVANRVGDAVVSRIFTAIDRMETVGV